MVSFVRVQYLRDSFRRRPSNNSASEKTFPRIYLPFRSDISFLFRRIVLRLCAGRYKIVGLSSFPFFVRHIEKRLGEHIRLRCASRVITNYSVAVVEASARRPAIEQNNGKVHHVQEAFVTYETVLKYVLFTICASLYVTWLVLCTHM